MVCIYQNNFWNEITILINIFDRCKKLIKW